MQKVYVVGFSVVTAGRHYDKGLRELAGNVLLKALEMSNDYSIDYLILASAFSDIVEEQLLASSYVCEFLSLEDVPNIRIELGDASSGAALRYGFELVKAGLADRVAIVGVDKMSDLTSVKVNKVLSYLCDSVYESYYGITPAVHAALMTKKYMEKYDYRYEDVILWSVKMHDHGANNPYAALRRKLTVKDILNSEIISDPIRLFDTALPLDGASCIILSSKSHNDFKILLEYCTSTSYNVSINMRDDLCRLYTLERCRDIISKFSPTLFELCDKYSIFGILSIESLGLSERGKAIQDLKNGKFDPGSSIVVNASGGLKCLGYTGGACGAYLATMLLMELLHLDPFKNIGNHNVGLVCDIAGTDRVSNVLIFRRES